MNDLTQAKRLIKECQETQNPYLDLGRCGITDLNDLPELFECSHLETLILSNEWYDAISDYHKISSKNVGNDNSFQSLPKEFGTLINLKKVILSSIGDSAIKNIDSLSTCQKIEYLDLSNNQINDIHFLEHLTGLQNLYLSSNQITDIRFLEHLTGLQTLDLRYNQITDIHFLEHLTGLQNLNLNSNQITDYSFLEHLTGLQKLDLSNNQITDYGFLEHLTGLQNLDLSSNQITDIRFLEQLTDLQNLDLSSNQITDIRFLEQLTDLQTLDLRNNQIKDIRFLEHLTELQNLDLRLNQITDIRFLEQLTDLQTLDLSSNKITDIRFLEHLTDLQNLNLSSNKITDIRFLEQLTGLRTLNLRYNRINDYSFLEYLTGLQNLDLSLNQITDIRFLEHLTGLQNLDLSLNQITDIRFLEHLTGLQNLDLNYNKITDIRFLEKLTGLHTLDLRNNQIKDIRFLENLTGLQNLNLWSNKITDISFLEDLTGLQTLNLSYNQITDICFLEHLTNLQNLYLSSNKITNYSFLEHLTGLQSLDLSDNQITDIHGLIPLLKEGVSVNFDEYGGGGISLFKNPIVNPPMHIAEQGSEAILDWFAQIDESGAEPFYESKLMILGQGGAGKTTFANLLLDPDYEVKPGKLDSTLGIVIHKGKEFPNSDKQKPNIKANLWDFGGQDIQKMLHQFFITEDCLYVLVSDKRAENTNFDYWFQIINLLGPKSHVIVLENPKEATGNNEDFPKNKYKQLYPDLNIESIEVNLNETRGTDLASWTKLQQMISEKLSAMELVNRMVPIKWGLVRKGLENLKNEKYITLDAYYDLCNQPDISYNPRQADWCLSYFRSLGDLVYFDDRDLCTRIFLDQNWLTTGLYYILSDTQIKEHSGRFTQQQAYDKWQRTGYNKIEKAMLIKLLLKDKFDICYELPDEKEVFITPLLLPPDAPEQKWEHETNLQFRFNYGFIPHGLFSRLIVQLHEKIDAEQHWKTGVRLKDIIDGEDVFAEVQQYNDPQENQQVIDIKISGAKNGCKQMLVFIRAAVEKLNKDFKNIRIKQVVACNCAICSERMKQGKKPSFHDYEMLWDRLLNSSYFVDCEKSKWKQVNIGQIINDVVIENAAIENRDNQLLKQLKEMGMSINQIINNNTVNSTNTNTNTNSNTNTISISIQAFLGEVQNLKEDFKDEKPLLLKKGISEDEYDVTLKDIGKAETAIQGLETAQKEGQALPERSKSRLKGFINDLSNEESTLHKGLKLFRKGRDYGVKIAELYNTVAGNTGMPLVLPLALDVIKKL